MSGDAPVLFVVEDEPVTAELIQLYFQNLGYDVSIARSGSSAKSLGERRRPDALVTDMLLEGAESGLSVARYYREKFPDLPIILTSGFPEAEIQAASSMIADVTVLPKPVRLSRLRAALEPAIGDRENGG